MVFGVPPGPQHQVGVIVDAVAVGVQRALQRFNAEMLRGISSMGQKIPIVQPQQNKHKGQRGQKPRPAAFFPFSILISVIKLLLMNRSLRLICVKVTVSAGISIAVSSERPPPRPGPPDGGGYRPAGSHSGPGASGSKSRSASGTARKHPPASRSPPPTAAARVSSPTGPPA